MTDLSAIIAAITGLVTALGVIIAAVLAYRARVAASEAKQKATDLEAQLVLIGDAVFQLGPQIDGRLTQLLESTGKAERAVGLAEGIKVERANPQSPTSGGR